jgi:hypothetical protein
VSQPTDPLKQSLLDVNGPAGQSVQHGHHRSGSARSELKVSMFGHEDSMDEEDLDSKLFYDGLTG